jgi:hypothetical protein
MIKQQVTTNDLFITNIKFKGHIYYLKNIKDLSIINIKLINMLV